MKKIVILLLFLFYCPFAHCLQEQHLVIINDNGEKKGAQGIADCLLAHGFDNRNIAAVYVSPSSREKHIAFSLAEIGLYKKDKLHFAKLLKAAKPLISNREKKEALLLFYREAGKNISVRQHIIFIVKPQVAQVLMANLTEHTRLGYTAYAQNSLSLSELPNKYKQQRNTKLENVYILPLSLLPGFS